MQQKRPFYVGNMARMQQASRDKKLQEQTTIDLVDTTNSLYAKHDSSRKIDSTGRRKSVFYCEKPNIDSTGEMKKLRSIGVNSFQRQIQDQDTASNAKLNQTDDATSEHLRPQTGN